MIPFIIISILLAIHVTRMVVVDMRRSFQDENTTQLQRLYKSQDKLNPYSYFQAVEPKGFWTYDVPAVFCILIQIALFFLPLYLTHLLTDASIFGFTLSAGIAIRISFLLLPILQIIVYKIFTGRNKDEQSLRLEPIYMAVVIAVLVLIFT